MVVLVKIYEISLSAVMVLSLKCAYGRSACGCYNASGSSKSARVAELADKKISFLIFFGKSFTVSHTRVAAVFVT